MLPVKPGGKMFGQKVCVLAIAFLALLAVYIFFFQIISPTWRELKLLAQTGHKTLGRVTAKEPQNHQLIRYEYHVDGQRYAGECNAGFGGLPPFDQIRVGDSIAVTYSLERPSISIGGDPKDMYGSWSGLLFLVLPLLLVIGAFFAIVRIRQRGRGRERKTQ
jgi:hypothetical protein